MRAFIYLKEEKNENLLADLEVEVCPRGIYEIDGKPYVVTGQPKFVIRKGDDRNLDTLRYVVLIATELQDKANEDLSFM